MTEAAEKGKTLRRRMLKDGFIDVEAAATALGVTGEQGLSGAGHRQSDSTSPATDGQPRYWRRWDLACAIGRHALHGGGQPDGTHKREAEEFAWAFLVEEREAETLRFREAWQWAAHFEIPEEVVRARGAAVE